MGVFEDLRYPEEDLEMLKSYRLLDDDFMTVVFKQNIEASELLLNIILQRSDIKVLSVETQVDEKNPVVGGRSITLDIFAVDSDGRHFDVEVQRADKGADPHRARFHSSILDTRMLKETQGFRELRDSYVIFITENDVMKHGLPMYHADRVIKELNQDLKDGSHIIYVNGAYKNDTDPVGKLMHDFRCRSAVDMFYSELAEPVRYYKETEGGQYTMCKAMEERIHKAEETVKESTRIETLLDSVKSLMKTLNMTIDQAMNALTISDEDRALIMKKF